MWVSLGGLGSVLLGLHVMHSNVGSPERHAGLVNFSCSPSWPDASFSIENDLTWVPEQEMAQADWWQMARDVDRGGGTVVAGG